MSETIKSAKNEKLKLVRRLAERRAREREGMFVTEGEDLLEAGLAAGFEPVELLTAAGSGIGGDEVEAELLAGVSGLGSGTRAIAIWEIPSSASKVPGGEGERPDSATSSPARNAAYLYLHGVGDPGNVGAIIRTTAALLDTPTVLGPGCADAYGAKAVRATMGAIFTQPPIQALIAETPEPRIALIAHGGEDLDAALSGAGDSAATICLGSEREGLPPEVLVSCQRTATIPVQPGTESLNVAAAAAIACQRISSIGAEPIAEGARPSA